MEQELVNQFIGLQFRNQGLFTDDSALIECECCIDAIVGHWAIHDVKVMGKASHRAIVVYETLRLPTFFSS